MDSGLHWPDQVWGDMTGDRLAMALKRIRPDLPIILCTGFSDRISPDKVEKLGIAAFVMKPVERASLAAIIRQVRDAPTP